MARQTRSFPDVFTGSQWQVVNAVPTQARTVPARSLQSVPFDAERCQCGEDHARTVRLRELVQAKRPTEELRGSDWAVKAAEHARGWALARDIATGPVKCPGVARGWLAGFQESLAEAGQDAESILQLSVPLAFSLSPRERAEISGEVGDILAQAPAVDINDGTGGYESAQALVHWLESWSPPPPDPFASAGTHWGEDTGDEWPEMTVLEDYPLSERVLSRTQRRRTAEEGDVIRDITRLHIDGRVFKAKARRSKTGTMLVDTSTSMSWQIGDLERVVSSAPAALIAAYSGNGGQGWLRVVAARGMRVPTHALSTPGGTNSVDVPALKWLARQKGPRVWYSDGEANCHGMGEYRAKQEANAAARAGNITRTQDLSEAIRLISGRR